jgi:3-oxoacyl-[acyl-carrier-protein] synthase-3
MVYSGFGEPAVGILGTGSCLPAQEIPNGEIAKVAGVTEEWILKKTGIRQRRWAAAHEATSDLATAAAAAALDAAGIGADQVGWVIVATSTPDLPQPATACLVQHQLGVANAGAFDLNGACAGFVTALSVAARLVGGAGNATPAHALVIGADIFSRIIDRRDPRTAVLFGDGAGAVVLGPVAPGRGVVAVDATSHGRHFDLIRVEAGGSRTPASQQSVADGLHYLKMNGRAVREFVVTELPAAIHGFLDVHRIDPGDIDHFVPHQANGVLLNELSARLKLPNARMHLGVGELGNTAAASIPVTLDRCRRFGCFADDDLLLLTGFGSGMSVGNVLLRWHGPRTGRTTTRRSS